MLHYFALKVVLQYQRKPMYTESIMAKSEHGKMNTGAVWLPAAIIATM
jgi:hypothetical protein